MSARSVPTHTALKELIRARRDLQRLVDSHMHTEESRESTSTSQPISATPSAPRDLDMHQTPSPKLKLRMTKTQSTKASDAGKNSPTPAPSVFTAINKTTSGSATDGESSGLRTRSTTPSATGLAAGSKMPESEQSAGEEGDDGEDGEKDGDGSEQLQQSAQHTVAAGVAPWECGNPRSCDTGQTYERRDGPNGFGRKVVSHFLGRNKQSTNRIPSGPDDDVWVYWCRKCYQRETYRCNNEVAKNNNYAFKCDWYIARLREQLERIQTYRPDALFEVALTKRAKARQAEYNKLIAQDKKSKTQALNIMAKKITKNKKTGKETPTPEELFPLDLAEEFSRDLEGINKTYDDLEAVITWIEGYVVSGALKHMPPVEFLLNDVRVGQERLSKTNMCKQLTERRAKGEDIYADADDEGDEGEADAGVEAESSEENEIVDKVETETEKAETEKAETKEAAVKGTEKDAKLDSVVKTESVSPIAPNPSDVTTPATPPPGNNEAERSGLDLLAMVASAAAAAPLSPQPTGAKRKREIASEDSKEEINKRHHA